MYKRRTRRSRCPRFDVAGTGGLLHGLRVQTLAPRLPPRLPRFLDLAQQRIEDERRLARILLETGETAPDAKTVTKTSHADPARLRGLPTIGRNVAGAMRGTDPVAELLRKERQRIGRV